MQISLVTIILILTCGVSIYAFSKEDLIHKWIYNPYSVYHRRQWYRIFTHALLHGSWMHLFLNMYILWMFSNSVLFYFQEYFGKFSQLYFLILYVGGILAAAIPGLIKHKDNHAYNSLGASGAVSAVIFTSIMLEPTRGLGIIFLPGLYIPAFIFGPLYLWLESYLDKRGGTNIAHDAHIFGSLFGVFFPIIVKPAIAVNFLAQIQNYISQFF